MEIIITVQDRSIFLKK